MKFAKDIKQLRFDTESQLTKNGYHNFWKANNYISEVYHAIDAMTHEVQFKVTMNVRGPISDATLPWRPPQIF